MKKKFDHHNIEDHYYKNTNCDMIDKKNFAG